MASVGGQLDATSAPIHDRCYLFNALRRQGLIGDQLVLQLATFLRSLGLFLKLRVRSLSRGPTAKQVRHGGKQGTDDPYLSRSHSNVPSLKFRSVAAIGR